MSLAVPLVPLLALSVIVLNSTQPQPDLVLYENRAVPHQRQYVQEAMRAWSKAIGVRWEEAAGRDPDLVIRSLDPDDFRKNCQDESCVGWSSTIGNKPGSTEILLSEQLSFDSFRALVIHELGHFFGLHHQENCSIMTDEGVLSPRCPGNKDRAFRCTLTEGHRQQLHLMYSLPSLPPKQLACLSEEEMQERVEFYE